ncbi:MAG: class I SAM-dependent methyltransferase [Pseudomonadales bacterium]|nr:class I SAM-dependent methyltransferase [Pseudomonadales bacterium]
MKGSTKTFTEFEFEGWGDRKVCENYDEHFGTVTIQSVEAMLDAADILEHCEVLDVCSGPGYAAGAAVERGANVIGIDFSESQVRLAKKRFPNAKFELGDATDLRFEANTFDAVVNGIGIPHFEAPDLAIKEAHRVLKSGGKFVFTVYDTPQNAVGFGILYSAIQSHGSMDMGLPAGPNFFLFSDPKEGVSRLEAAGFESVHFTSVPQTWNLSSPEQLIDAVENGSVRAAATLQAQTPEAQEAVKTAVTNNIGKYKKGDEYELPMPVILYSATKTAPE